MARFTQSGTGDGSGIPGPQGPQGNPGADGADGTNFTGYDHEIHVSQVDGNDTTGNGDLLTPVASITKALTLVDSQRKTIIVHPGTYTESPSITTQYTTLTGPGLIGGNIVISGTVSTSVGCTISGLKMTNLTVTTPTSTGNVNILNCEVSGTLTKSSNADYTVLRLCDLAAASITGSGLVAIFGGNPNFITVNNASANVLVKSAITVAPVLTAGTLSIVDSVVGAAVTNAVTSAASSIITLSNSQFLTSNLSGVAPVVLNGFYSIFNCVYDKPNSTLVASSGTGGTTNSVDYFQYINADKFITQGGTSSQFVKGDGSLDSVNPANTGDITFDGVQIIGAGTASGDGLENGTIDLVPDGTLETDQYLIIDPTAPNHIHIRAGGAQDASSSSLILGGERNHVLVEDSGRTVSVSTRPETVVNTYTNTNPTSNTNFTVSNAANIYVGDTVFYAGGDVLTVDSVTPDSPTAGTQTVTANLNGTPGQFIGNGAHIFSHEQEWNNGWIFGNDGYLTGPAMGGLFVSGLLNGEGDLWLGSNYNVVLSPGPENAAYVGDASNVDNQIATVGDLPTGATGTFETSDSKLVTVTNGIITTIESLT